MSAVVVDRVICEVYCDQYEEHIRRSLATVLAFVAATATAVVAMRSCSLYRVVRYVRKRNEAQRSRGQRTDPERILELVTAFADLRPFLFSWRDACLFESLALIEFLAWHRIFPKWVFGVQARPFAAHCWVQQDDTVLNDTIERVGAYTPIMIA